MRAWMIGSLLLFFLPGIRAEDKTFYSQASQDRFVYEVLYRLSNFEGPGCYLEIGAGEPISINNTYYLEQHHDWNGVSIDISETVGHDWIDMRKNPLLVQDALQVNYRDILNGFPPVIDYLSLDIDGSYTDVLKLLPLSDYRFKMITIEHDFYRFGDLFRTEERAILQKEGYLLIAADVCSQGFPYEDWWVDPQSFSIEQLDVLQRLDLNGQDHQEILRKVAEGIDEYIHD
jgi:hypothetical protein